MAEVATLNSERGQSSKRNRSRTRKEEKQPLAPNNQDDDVKHSTKAAFDVLLKQALANNDTQPTKGRKKKDKDNARDIVLANLKKGKGIKKDEEDPSILANTYDPNNEAKNKKSNRQRQKQNNDTGTDNLAYEENEDLPLKSEKKRKKKKRPETEETLDEPEKGKINISDLAPPVVQKKTRKKKPKVKEETEEECQSQEELCASPLLENESSPEQAVPQQDETPVKTKCKRKKKVVEKTESAEELEHTQDEAESVGADGSLGAESARAVDDDGRVLGITVHRTDRLKTDFYITHPLVRVQVIDIETGNHLKKSDVNRAVTSYFETQNENVDYILPMMTQPFDFKKQKSMQPVWEELLIFNENSNYLIQDDTKAIIFFELMDFVKMNTVNKSEQGWHRIAWAFLKLVGGNAKLNVDKKVRLQLFQPPSRFRASPDQIEVYQWWRTISTRIPYPSTLYVTARRMLPPPKVEPASRSMFALQEERGKMTYLELQKTLEMGSRFERDEGRTQRMSNWSRFPGQVCKIPNTAVLSLPAAKRGCFVMKFSHDGKFLACGCHDGGTYPILVYEIPSGKLKGQLSGHHGIIYDLSWGKNNALLLSSSSDSTAKQWDIEAMSVDKLLPHPAFVYAAQYHVRVNKVVVTGCYDRVIRIWSTQSDTQYAQLEQELEGHPGHINTLCFDEEGQKMFSGDNTGVLCVWNCYVTDQPSKSGVLRDWNLHKEVTNNEWKDACINHIQLHPGGRRLLIHCRDNTIRMMDLRVYSTMQRYMGALNFREKIRSTVTPCGSFVISGSEDCAAYVWNAETGDQVAMYSDMNYKHAVCCTTYHPHEHMVAFCAFGENQPISVYNYDYKVAQYEAGFEDAPEATSKVIPQNQEFIKTQVEDVKPNTTTDDFRVNETARMQRINRKLESVMAFTQSTPRAMSPDPNATMPGMVTNNTMMTWGSTFDSTILGGTSQVTRSGNPQPSAFTPHASKTMTNTIQQQQFTSQMQYMKQSGGGWRPGFSQVGKAGYMGRPPNIALNTTQDKPQFTFQGPASGRKKLEQVVALYDYAAQRSDELSFMRGDIITVLYKDNENWWMGELPDDTQGFFPSNYVAERSTGIEEDLKRLAADKTDSQTEDDSASRMHAVISKSGEFKLISEDSDVDTPVKSRRKKKSSKPSGEETQPTVEYRKARRKSRASESTA